MNFNLMNFFDYIVMDDKKKEEYMKELENMEESYFEIYKEKIDLKSYYIVNKINEVKKD
ncbi:MAG: hypothetical protein ACRCZ0_12475 [Cetobacterium sp.]